MGLLDQQQPMQQMGGAQMGGGLLGGMGGMQQQGMPQGEMQMPPEMMQVVEKIKTMPPEQQVETAKQIIMKLQQAQQPEQEKQSAIAQFIKALQG